MKQGWQIKRLGEICDILNGFAFKSNEYVKEGVRVIRITNVQKGKIVDEEPKFFPVERSDEISKYILQEGDLLMSLTGNVGRVGILSSSLLPAALNQRVACLRIKDKTISIKYLFHLLNSNLFEKDCIGSASGIAQLNMSTKWLEQYEMVIPPPSEQQRIVNLLDAECAKIDALKANAEKNLQNAKDLFQAALRKELEPKKGWITKTLGDVCDVQCGSTPLRSEPLFWENGTYPWFTVDDIREQGRVITDTKQKITKLAWDKLRVFPVNSVLLCCTASVGEYAITTIPLTSNQQFNGLTIKKGFDITPMYLFHFASTLKDKLLKLSGKATIDFVSGAKVKSIVISYPSMAEQQSIVARLDALNEKCKTLQSNYEKTLSLCDDLKQALLRKAFNGEI